MSPHTLRLADLLKVIRKAVKGHYVTEFLNVLPRVAACVRRSK